MYSEPYTPKWKRRAECVGFLVWKGKALREMTEKEIEAAFSDLSREHRISYIWGSV